MHCERGLVPALAGPHSPLLSPDSLFSAEHALHAPSHASLQQTPSAQLRPRSLGAARSHASPFLRGTTREPLLQKPVDAQSPSTLQLVPHAAEVPEQRP